VVAPDLSAELPVTWKARRYRAGDLNGAALAFTATSDRRVNARVATDAKALGVPVNVADVPSEGDFIVPARVRKNGFHIAISTDGANPRASAALRRQLENSL
jgi:siroheme synthase-like protein